MTFTFSKTISRVRTYRLGLQRAAIGAVTVAQRDGQETGYIGFVFEDSLYTVDFNDTWNDGRFCMDCNTRLICKD